MHWLKESAYQALLNRAWERGRRPVRLLGAGLRLEPRGRARDGQLTLFEPPADQQHDRDSY